MAKGVIINLNSGSDYTDCSVYTGLTETTATGSTVFTSVTGGTINLEGLSDTLEEIYVKIVCVGCCEQIFYVCLNTSTPTPTPTVTVTNSQTVTPTITATPDQLCYCYSFEVTSSEATINYITCNNVVTNISGVTSGATYQICSIVDPVAIEGTATITLNGICVDGNCPTPTPTPTPTVTITSTPTVTPTLTITQSVTPTITPTVTALPTLSMSLWTAYQLISGGTTYQVSSTAPTSTNAQNVYCEISDRETGAGITGSVRWYYQNPLGIGTRLYNSSSYLPAVNLVGYYNTTGTIGQPTGTTYYVKTNSSGDITDFLVMDYCWRLHNVIWSFTFDCATSCDLTGASTGVVVYTEGSNNSWGTGTLVYSNPERTTYFSGGRYIKYQGYIWENDGANGLIQVCVVGQPC